MKPKIYTVELYRYPEIFEIKANSKEEATQLAKDKVSFAIWETKVKVSQ